MHRRSGGCLYGLIFILALVGSAVIIAIMLSSTKGSSGKNLLSSVIERLTGEETDTDEQVNPIADIQTDTPDNADTSTDTDENTDTGSDGATTDAADSADNSEITSSSAVTVEVKQEKLKELMQTAADEKFPLTLDSVVISGEGTIQFTGSMQRDEFIDFVKESGTTLGLLESAALKLAPTELSFDAVTEVDFDPQTGTVTLDPKSLKVESLSLPVDLLPQMLVDEAETALTGYLTSYGMTPVQLSLYDGYIKIFFE